MLKEASAKSTDQIRASELKLADEFRKLGKTVVEVDREAFRKAARAAAQRSERGRRLVARPNTTRCRR